MQQEHRPLWRKVWQLFSLQQQYRETVKYCLYLQHSVTLKKAVPQHTYGGAWGKRMCSSYSFTTSVLDRGEWSESRPGFALPPGKGPQVPTVQEAGWAPEPVWTQSLEEKSLASAGDWTSIVQSVARDYMDSAARFPLCDCSLHIIIIGDALNVLNYMEYARWNILRNLASDKRIGGYHIWFGRGRVGSLQTFSELFHAGSVHNSGGHSWST
jgi:hypothetical protein